MYQNRPAILLADNDPRQMLFENPSLDTSLKAFISLDTLSGGDPCMDFSDTHGSMLLKRLVSRQSQALQRAGALYRTMRFAAQISRFLSWLFHRPDHLIDASEIILQEIFSHCYSGLQTVPINRFIASERCSQDFDSAFHPLQDEDRTRWTNIAALKLLGANLPPVDLFQIQDVYIVRDGHQRISVACAFGQKNIAAFVTQVQSPDCP